MKKFFRKKRHHGGVDNNKNMSKREKKNNFRNQHDVKYLESQFNFNDSTLIYAKIGKIVERVNFIELQINKIIANFYISPENRDMFLEDFMFAGRLRLNDKIKILREVLIRKNISFDEQSFERWIHIRNMVAHGTPSRGIDRQAILHFNGQIYDIDMEFRDFEKLQSKMENLIAKICDNC